MAATKMVDAVVAHGRSLRVGADGKTKTYLAGESVKLPADEIAGLKTLGFLVDSEAVVIPTADGPTFGTNEGPKVEAGA